MECQNKSRRRCAVGSVLDAAFGGSTISTAAGRVCERALRGVQWHLNDKEAVGC